MATNNKVLYTQHYMVLFIFSKKLFDKKSDNKFIDYNEIKVIVSTD